jgi:hypothetical protein
MQFRHFFSLRDGSSSVFDLLNFAAELGIADIDGRPPKPLTLEIA